MRAATNVPQLFEQRASDNTEPFKRRTHMIELCGLASSEKQFSKGELIFGPYDTEEKVFVVRRGEVEIYQLSLEGKKVIIDILVPGNVFANSPFFSEPSVESNDFAMARSQVDICVFRKADFMNVLRTTPQVTLRLLTEISTRLTHADNRIKDLALSDATTRLISELVRIGQKIGSEADHKIVLRTRITHEELGEMTGVARETITRVLKKLRQERIVDLDNSKHLVIDKCRAKEALNSAPIHF